MHLNAQDRLGEAGERPSVLVPGAGLGRLCHDIASLGFDCEVHMYMSATDSDVYHDSGSQGGSFEQAVHGACITSAVPDVATISNARVEKCSELPAGK